MEVTRLRVHKSDKIHTRNAIFPNYFSKMVIGLISDTHGRLRPEVLTAFAGVDMILHAGDIGGAAVIEGLQAIAPVQQVRGNNDDRADGPDTVWLRVDEVPILMLHELAHLTPVMLATEPRIVIFGHSHKPANYTEAGVQFINPGAAGSKRFSLPISVARLHIEGADWRVEFINLLDDRPLP